MVQEKFLECVNMINRKEEDVDKASEVVTLGGGCFWCLEAAFDQIEGVIIVESGYSGGVTESPTYEQVCTGSTGHAEVVQVIFNPDIVSFREILDVFFTIHNPTTLNRQGADIGTQYRSVIFYHNKKQKEIAEQVINELEMKKVWDDPIVTKVEPFRSFYKAEEYHRQYFTSHPEVGYCRVVIAPKVAKLRKKHWKKLKKR